VVAQPRYLQIADDLRTRIQEARQDEDGEYQPGARLPTEDQLGDKFNASRNTIRDAIKRLINLGLVETRPGQGTFVTRSIDPFVTVLTNDPKTGFGGGEGATYLSAVSDEHREPSVSPPRVEVQVPPAKIARRLRLQPDAQVVSRHEQRFIDGRLWSLQTSFYPLEFIQLGAVNLIMAQNIDEGTVRYLAKTINVRQTGYRDWITARLPNDQEQEFFGIGHNSTVFEIFRTAFDQNNKPMRLTVTVYPADRNQFIVNVGDDLPDPKYDEESGGAAA
jgi:GntR family transcriptional regulator